MRIIAIVGLLVMHASVLSAQLSFDSARVRAAIDAGVSTKELKVLRAGSAGSGFVAMGLRRGGVGHAILMTGPYNRVTNAAAANAKRYMPFTIDSVQSWMIEPVLAIRVEPTAPVDVSHETAPAVQHVVLIPKSGIPRPVQPSQVEPTNVKWANGFGATFTTAGVLALFPMDSIPKGDFDIVVITAKGENRYKIGADDMLSVRQ